MTTINYNGSKWAGQAADGIDGLFERLASEPLNPMFEKYGNFVLDDHKPVIRFWGNFLNLSAVFSIDTDEPEMIERLTKAIRANQHRPDYLEAR